MQKRNLRIERDLWIAVSGVLLACNILQFNCNPVTPVQPVATRPVIFEEPRESDIIENALLSEADRIDNMTITHYCICEKCCGKKPSDPAYGITASGLKATPGVSVAVDPDVIPLGSDVIIDWGDGNLQYCRADDTGSAIKGNHIDLCMENHQAALEAGVKYATVYVVR